MDRPSRPADPSDPGAVPGPAGAHSGHDGSPSSATADGVVEELLLSQLVRVTLDGRHQVTAHLADPGRRNFVRVLVGDRVRVVLIADDRTRGRVVEKLK